MRPAGFRAGARQPLTAKRLHTHHRANLIAVHIQIAHACANPDRFNGFFDARMHAQCEAIAARVNRIDHLQQFARLKRDHMQHRAEHFILDGIKAGNFKRAGRKEMSLRNIHRQRRLSDLAKLRGHAFAVRDQHLKRLAVDHRADVGVEPRRIAQCQFLHRAFQQKRDARRDVLLHAQNSQRRTALPGTVEGRSDHIIHHLLRQGG